MPQIHHKDGLPGPFFHNGSVYGPCGLGFEFRVFALNPVSEAAAEAKPRIPHIPGKLQEVNASSCEDGHDLGRHVEEYLLSLRGSQDPPIYPKP